MKIFMIATRQTEAAASQMPPTAKARWREIEAGESVCTSTLSVQVQALSVVWVDMNETVNGVRIGYAAHVFIFSGSCSGTNAARAIGLARACNFQVYVPKAITWQEAEPPRMKGRACSGAGWGY